MDNTGYQTTNVLVDASSVGPVVNYTFGSVIANRSIVAEFAENASGTYTLTYVAGANGSISGAGQQVVSLDGSGTAVTAVPDAGHHFEGWSDGSSANPRAEGKVTESLVITANFAVNVTPTSVSLPVVSPARPRRGRGAVFTSYAAPGAAAVSGGSTLRLYHYETKTVRRRVRGRIRRVRVKYWRLRSAVTMSPDASGRLRASAKLRYAGKWRAQVSYLGSPLHTTSLSGVRAFTVR
jgi:hypothetical protein